MGKGSLEDAVLALGSLFLCLLGFNAVMFLGIGYPIVYCTLGGVASSLYINWAHVVLLVLSAVVVLSLFRGQTRPAIGAAVAIIGIIELPRLMEQGFHLGGSCG